MNTTTTLTSMTDKQIALMLDTMRAAAYTKEQYRAAQFAVGCVGDFKAHLAIYNAGKAIFGGEY